MGLTLEFDDQSNYLQIQLQGLKKTHKIFGWRDAVENKGVGRFGRQGPDDPGPVELEGVARQSVAKKAEGQREAEEKPWGHGKLANKKYFVNDLNFAQIGFEKTKLLDFILTLKYENSLGYTS